MKYLVYIFILVFVSTTIGIMICVDYLIRFQYKNHRTAWEKDGCPAGIFGFPKFSFYKYIPIPKFSTGIISTIHQKKMLFSTPTWIAQNSSAKRALSLFRIFTLLFYLNIIIPFLFIIIYGIFINS